MCEVCFAPTVSFAVVGEMVVLCCEGVIIARAKSLCGRMRLLIPQAYGCFLPKGLIVGWVACKRTIIKVFTFLCDFYRGVTLNVPVRKKDVPVSCLIEGCRVGHAAKSVRLMRLGI